MEELKQCPRCGNYHYPDTTISYLVYEGFREEDYLAIGEQVCFDCAFEELDCSDGDDGGLEPPGCRDCGGDYPNCRSSCPLYDE